MTTIDEETGLLTQAQTDAMTRAELLVLCRAKGWPATAWNRGRMAACLTGAEPAPRPKVDENGVKLPKPVADRSEDEGDAEDSLRALSREAKIALHVGACIAPNCKCEAFEFGRKDAFGWRLCECQHTDQGHAIPAELRAGVEAEFKAKRGKTS